VQSDSTRDHLFISYAGEDWSFAEWLALRLTAEGYKVWCDRFKLLGGESYPKDIDDAIKNGSFRLLAVLSRHSIRKPNPLKERTLALNLARQRNENFLIPLNLDGRSPTDLDWMVSDLTFVAFHLSWAEGLAQLLTLLQKSDAPRTFDEGRSAAASWFDTKKLVSQKEERLWGNIAAITELPTDIYRFEMEANVPDDERLEILKLWPNATEGNIHWSFVYPPPDIAGRYRLKVRGKIADWKAARSSDINVRRTATYVFNQSLRSLCLSRGLKLTPDGTTCYFPDSLLPNNRLPFTSYDGSRTWVRSVGVRNFKTLTGREACRYHLAPNLKVWLDHDLGNFVHVRVRLLLTTLSGTPLEEKPALRRRKRICRTWWNYEWLSRTLAVLQFLSGDNPTIQIDGGELQKMIVSNSPLTVDIGFGLDESLLQPQLEETEESLLTLEDEEEPTEEGDNEQ